MLRLLVLGVAGQPDHFHAVEQRRRDVQAVRSADEHHLGQVEVDLEVVIVERRVLLRVEHFEQRRGRIAAEVHRHLVDFVEQEQRIADAGPRHVLHDLAGHRADVGAAMAADLGLVAHAAERHARRTCGWSRARCSGRATSCRRPGGPTRHRIGPLQRLHALLHGEVLDDALLDLVEPEVVFVQHAARRRRCRACTLVRFFHGHLDQPVDVVADDGRLGRHRRHELELAELASSPCRLRFLRHAGALRCAARAPRSRSARRPSRRAPSGSPSSAR